MLVALAGLPGTGKTTLARALARRLAAVHLRIDTIEQAMRSSALFAGDIGPAGYVVAYAVAEDNLRLGRTVIADSVNPVWQTRQAWRDVAARAGARIVDIEVVCSDAAEHRRRVETRKPDIAGFRLPTWEEVVGRPYEAWPVAPLRIDTAQNGAPDLDHLIASLAAVGSP